MGVRAGQRRSSTGPVMSGGRSETDKVYKLSIVKISLKEHHSSHGC